LIPIEIYSTVYYLILSILVVLSILPLFKYSDLNSFPRSNLKLGNILLLSITILFIGLRDPWGNWRYLGDTSAYSLMFQEIDNIKFYEAKDIGFTFFMYLCKIFLNHQFFFLVSALLYVGFVYLFAKRTSKENGFFLFVMFVTSMSFWSFGINGVRNGLATSLFLYALTFRNKKWFLFLFMLISISFHKSMILPVIAYFIANYFTNTKLLIRIWFVSVVVSYFFGNYIETYISNLIVENAFEDSRFMTFTSENGIDLEVSTRSFRLDFILYSSIPIFLGYFYRYKRNFNEVFYLQLLHTYIITNTVWVLLIYSSFTNRTAYLSWFLMPFILVYPLLRNNHLFKKQNNILGIFFILSLFFTLFIYFNSSI